MLKEVQTPTDEFNRKVDVLTKGFENGTVGVTKYLQMMQHLEQVHQAAINPVRALTEVEKQYAAAIEKTVKIESTAAEVKSRRWSGGAPGASSGLQAAGKMVGGQAGGLMTMGASLAVPVGIGLAVKQTLSLASAAEQAQAKFEILSGSVGTASALVSAMKKLDAESPLNFASIQKAGVEMAQVGMANSQLLPLMKSMGEITGGNTEKFLHMAHALSQVQTLGHLMAQDKNQFVQAGFNPLVQIAKDLKVDVKEVVAMMADGAISADMVKNALLNATAAGGKYFGMTERLSQTGEMAFTKTISDLEKIGMQIGGGILPVAVELLGMFRSVLPIIQPIAAVIEAWGDGMSIILGYTRDILEDLIAMFTLDFKKGIGAWIHGNSAFQKVIDEQNEITGAIVDQEVAMTKVVEKSKEQLALEEQIAKYEKQQADWKEKNAAAFESVMGPLQKQLDVYIFGAEAAKRNELAQQSITWEQTKQIEAAEKQLKIFNDQKAATEKAAADKKKNLEETTKFVETLNQQGRALTEKHNPVAAVTKQLADLKVLLGVNAIDTKTFTLEQNRILAEASKNAGQNIAAPASVDVGSQEAYKFMVDAQNDRTAQQLQKLEEQRLLQASTVVALKEANETLKAIKDGNVKRIR